MRGRKRKEESRAEELREKLSEWRQMPESLRPSLRKLASDLGVSHQLLSYCLKTHPMTRLERLREALFRIRFGLLQRDALTGKLSTGKILRLLPLLPEARYTIGESLNIQEVGQALAVQPATVRKWLRMGKLPHSGGGRFARIPLA